MESLRERLQSIEDIQSDAYFGNEKRVFIRLLYRNRSQHRHGFYFRRLEHVRRLLKKIELHEVWGSVQHVLGDEGQRKRAKALLPVSSLTLNDLQSVEHLLHQLIHIAISSASNRISTELVAREQFLPFAVTMLASLSRMFVINKTLLSEVRGAVVELKLLFPPVEKLSSENKATNLEKDEGLEDIGQEIKAPSNTAAISAPSAQVMVSHVPKPFQHQSLIQNSSADEQGALKEVTSTGPDNVHRDTRGSEVDGNHNAKHSQPTSNQLQAGERRDEASLHTNPVMNQSETKQDLSRFTPSEHLLPLSEIKVFQFKPPETASGKPDIISKSSEPPHQQDVVKSGKLAEGSASSREQNSDSDSEDLDDIFAGMED